MERERPTTGRYLKSTVVAGYTLLNSEKLNRVLDLIDGITQPRNSEEGRVLKEALAIKGTKEIKGTDMAILALYDRLGGGIKDGERKVKVGVFYDFKARKPRTEPFIDEEDYEDEMVLVRKKNRRASTKETDTERIKRLENKSESKTDDDEDQKTPAPVASPSAIKKAEELGVDISTVIGTGANGNITIKDIETAAESK